MSALLPLLSAVLLSAAPKAPAAAPEGKPDPAIAARARALLAALSAKDVKALAGLLDTGAVLSFGNDVAEVCADAACIEKQARDAFAVVDAARYGEAKKMHVEASPTLATAWFDVPAEVVVGKEKKSVTQRFATTWRLVGAEWKLAQWLRFSPTVERSARELLKDNELK